MTRLGKKERQLVRDLFFSGTSMELLAERLRVGIWQIEAIIRATKKRVQP
jgi:hypothetical protein